MPDWPEASGRRHQRIRYETGSVAVRNKLNSPFVTGVLINLSLSGCRVEVPATFDTDSGEVISIRLDLNTIVVVTLGFVRHFDRENSALGLEFYRMSEQNKVELANFIEYFSEH